MADTRERDAVNAEQRAAEIAQKLRRLVENQAVYQEELEHLLADTLTLMLDIPVSSTAAMMEAQALGKVIKLLIGLPDALRARAAVERDEAEAIRNTAVLVD